MPGMSIMVPNADTLPRAEFVYGFRRAHLHFKIDSHGCHFKVTLLTPRTTQEFYTFRYSLPASVPYDSTVKNVHLATRHTTSTVCCGVNVTSIGCELTVTTGIDRATVHELLFARNRHVCNIVGLCCEVSSRNGVMEELLP